MILSGGETTVTVRGNGRGGVLSVPLSTRRAARSLGLSHRQDLLHIVLPMPPGITTVQIDRSSGLPAGADDTNIMSEIFKVEDVDRLRNQANQQQEDQDQQHAYDIF